MVAVNAAASAAGVRVGMRRREAEGVCPTVATVVSDPGAEMAAFEQVAAAVEELVPKVEVAQPGLMFVPVAGAVRFYGGEEPLVEMVAKEVEAAAGPGSLIGLAAGPFAARHAAARAAPGEPHVVGDDAAFLSSLDVAALGREELAATFRWLGIRTLGELAGLPREAMASRFGAVGLEAHRLATGEDRRVRPRRVPDDLAVEECFDPPLNSLEPAGFAARSLASRLMERMAAAGALPHRVEVAAESAAGAVRSRTWRSNDPFDEATLAERVRWQLRAWAESGGIPGGLSRLRLMPADLSDRGRQLGLAEDAAATEEARRALARAQALVGPDAVLQARPQGGRDPAERVSWYRWGEPRPPDATPPHRGRGGCPRPPRRSCRPSPGRSKWSGRTASPPGSGSAAAGSRCCRGPARGAE